ncbi:MlaD family protein [Trinickia dinghuensis]|uniref:MCE family protein n=1 Tax=Trinickia dinghuensis TaxID=2291023 RepID=A0A3D8JSM3_9BURK|nr:MlaD family protein [Trinickia dinghuensis]RDU96139.1 MCE family protein [Trinickia dinghuensis]
MNEPAEKRTEGADVKRSRWPGWIWAVPIAAIGVAGWLGIRALVQGGETVTIVFDDAYGMQADNTEVSLHGVKVGEVRDVALDGDGRHVDVKVEIRRSADPYLRTGTRFWVKGARFDFSDPSSAKALLGGPEIVMQPGSGAATRKFEGSDRAYSPAAAVRYVVRFPGAVGQLDEGAQVRLRGFRVGEVTQVSLHYDASTGTLDTPVEIVLDATQLGFAESAKPADGNWRPVVDDMLRHLIATGLRARLTQDPPLVGSHEVTLDFVPGAPSATLAARNGETDIPSAPTGDVDAIVAQAGDVMSKADHIMTKIDALPIEETGDNVRRITARIRALSSSPQIADSLDHIDRSVAQIDKTLNQVSPQIGPLVTQLRQTAHEADSAVAAANRTIGGDPMRQNDLPAALRELTDMARSVRALADYLERHPEALVRGKGGKGQ